MFNLLKIFTKKADDKYITIKNRGFNIILSLTTYNELKDQGYTISIVLNPKTKLPTCIQLNKYVNGKTKYYGTLKSKLKVKGFKDGNICNFHKSNLILEK